MITAERCVMCKSGAGEDVEHLLVICVGNLRGIGGYWRMR